MDGDREKLLHDAGGVILILFFGFFFSSSRSCLIPYVSAKDGAMKGDEELK